MTTTLSLKVKLFGQPVKNDIRTHESVRKKVDDYTTSLVD